MFLGAFSLLAGCGKKEEDPTHTRFRSLGILIGQYIAGHSGAAPRSAEDLKKFAQSLPAERLQQLKIDANELDQLVISPRDQQPIVFRALPRGGGADPSQGAVIAYEKVGSGGKRYVIYHTPPGKAEEVDEDRFKELVPEAK
jgi:hypothetical protein